MKGDSLAAWLSVPNCGTTFNVSAVRDEYHELGGEGDYDGQRCSECAIPTLDTNLGRAIDMMNGDEDYDEEHVEKYL